MTAPLPEGVLILRTALELGSDEVASDQRGGRSNRFRRECCLRHPLLGRAAGLESSGSGACTGIRTRLLKQSEAGSPVQRWTSCLIPDVNGNELGEGAPSPEIAVLARLSGGGVGCWTAFGQLPHVFLATATRGEGLGASQGTATWPGRRRAAGGPGPTGQGRWHRQGGRPAGDDLPHGVQLPRVAARQPEDARRAGQAPA